MATPTRIDFLNSLHTAGLIREIIHLSKDPTQSGFDKTRAIMQKLKLFSVEEREAVYNQVGSKLQKNKVEILSGSLVENPEILCEALFDKLPLELSVAPAMTHTQETPKESTRERSRTPTPSKFYTNAEIWTRVDKIGPIKMNLSQKSRAITLFLAGRSASEQQYIFNYIRTQSKDPGKTDSVEWAKLHCAEDIVLLREALNTYLPREGSSSTPTRTRPPQTVSQTKTSEASKEISTGLYRYGIAAAIGITTLGLALYFGRKPDVKDVAHFFSPL